MSFIKKQQTKVADESIKELLALVESKRLMLKQVLGVPTMQDELKYCPTCKREIKPHFRCVC